MVLLGALILLVFGTVLQPTVVAGRSFPVPISSVPKVGDCLLEPPRLPWTPGSPLVISACVGPRFGEVSGVLDASQGGPATGQPCSRAGMNPYDYLGVTALVGANSLWVPTLRVNAIVVGPNKRQRAAGQIWTACVLTPGAAPETYEGSLKDGYRALPSAFARCVVDAEPLVAEPVSCAAAHRYEIFGQQAVAGPGPPPAELTRSCQEFVALLTGTADPAAGGSLLVEAVAYKFDSAGPADPTSDAIPAGASGIVLCVVVPEAERDLARSLIGLGSAPIPWAS